MSFDISRATEKSLKNTEEQRTGSQRKEEEDHLTSVSFGIHSTRFEMRLENLNNIFTNLPDKDGFKNFRMNRVKTIGQ